MMMTNNQKENQNILMKKIQISMKNFRMMKNNYLVQIMMKKLEKPKKNKMIKLKVLQEMMNFMTKTMKVKMKMKIN